MLRHSVLWIMREPLSESARLRMLQRLAFLGTEPPSVTSGDYGADLFGGSEILHKVRPSQRVPTWRRGADGPMCDYDMALHLDFADWDAFQEYAVDDPAHAQASDANEVDNWDEITARCDWYYEGDAPPTHAGEVKHVAMFLWADGASDDAKGAAREAVETLAQADEVESVLIGDNVGNPRPPSIGSSTSGSPTATRRPGSSRGRRMRRRWRPWRPPRSSSGPPGCRT